MMPNILIVNDESPTNFVFEIREATLKSAFDTLKFVLLFCLILIGLPIGLYFLKTASDVPLWLRSGANVVTIPCLIVNGIVISILVFGFQIPAFRNASRPPNQAANFDLRTGLAKGIIKQDIGHINYKTWSWEFDNRAKTWEFEINRVKTLTLIWDDPRFDLTLLEIQDADGSVLHTFWGSRKDLRQIGEKLSIWLGIPFKDNAPDWNWKAQNNS